ncbi:MAG: hypothetical protein MUF54_18000, partial [Polyangiaceae bacterium]|nr:hypothetical protein [Polyangiaceae bacterium]
MSPELIIASVSATAGALLVIGGWVTGLATAQKQERRRFRQISTELETVTQQLHEVTAKADDARAQFESAQLKNEERFAAALGVEVAKNQDRSKALDAANGRIRELEKVLGQARQLTDEADKEFLLVRERLDQTEKRLEV